MKNNISVFDSKRPVGANPYSRLAATSYASLFPVDLHDSPTNRDSYACILSLGYTDEGVSRVPSTIYSKNIRDLAETVSKHLADKRFAQIRVNGLVPKLLENPNFPETSEFKREHYALDDSDFNAFVNTLVTEFTEKYDLNSASYVPKSNVVDFEAEQKAVVNYD